MAVIRSPQGGPLILFERGATGFGFTTQRCFWEDVAARHCECARPLTALPERHGGDDSRLTGWGAIPSIGGQHVHPTHQTADQIQADN